MLSSRCERNMPNAPSCDEHLLKTSSTSRGERPWLTCITDCDRASRKLAALMRAPNCGHAQHQDAARRAPDQFWAPPTECTLTAHRDAEPQRTTASSPWCRELTRGRLSWRLGR